MSKWKNEQTDALCDALLCLETKNECYAFLEDICTVKEVSDLAQRLAVAKMLNEGFNYNEIAAKTGASSATISRINKCYEYGTGGYKLVIDKTHH